MSVTFTWSLANNSLMTETHNGNPDTVVAVHLTLTATDGTNTVDSMHVAQLTPSTDGTFIPFSQLTEEQVLGWAKAAIDPENVARFEDRLTRMLDRMANPPVRPVPKAAPWNTCSPR